jgi:hypothetical protein
MSHRLTRRLFVGLPAAGLATLLPSTLHGQPPAAAAPVDPGTDWLPRQDPALAKEVVGVSHGNLARLRELVERQPALARASVDWGFGDWETALGAAAHTGRREIAELLLANGAPPSLFSAAMLGQVDVVRALVAARPGVQGMLGPHGITLLAHARTGDRWRRPIVMDWSAATASAAARATSSISTSSAINPASSGPVATAGPCSTPATWCSFRSVFPA